MEGAMGQEKRNIWGLVIWKRRLFGSYLTSFSLKNQFYTHFLRFSSIGVKQELLRSGLAMREVIETQLPLLRKPSSISCTPSTHLELCFLVNTLIPSQALPLQVDSCLPSSVSTVDRGTCHVSQEQKIEQPVVAQ